MSIRRQALTVCGALLRALAISGGYAQAQTPPSFATVHDFRDGGKAGAFPYYAGVIIGADGVLYGVTQGGGDVNSCRCGVVYSVSPPADANGSWTESVLYNFGGGVDSAGPIGDLAIGLDGVLYGVTYDTVFCLTPPASAGGAWTENTVYSFPGGSGVSAGVTMGEGGLLYGATSNGGTLGYGTLFSLTRPAAPGGAWSETVLYSFTGGDDGGFPRGPVAIGGRGVLFGTTFDFGGKFNGGTVFALTAPSSPGGAWTHTVLHRFTNGSSDGAYPTAGVTMGTGGVLYGTTSQGGTSLAGTVFSLTPPVSPSGNWVEEVIHSFAGGSADGASPLGGVTIDNDGVLYGTTQYGGEGTACGSGGCGTVFSFAPPSSPGGAWTETVLHSFSGAPNDGSEPEASVAISKGGALFGTTVSGGTGRCRNSSGCGTVFALKP
jgi:hypothetical protein